MPYVYDVETGKYLEDDVNEEIIPDIKEEPTLEDRVEALEDVIFEGVPSINFK